MFTKFNVEWFLFLFLSLPLKKKLCSLKSLKTYTVVHNIHKQSCFQKILSTNTDYAGNLLIFHVTQLWFMTRNLPNWWLSRPSSTFMYISTSPSQSSVSLSKTVIIFSVFSWCFYGNFAPTVYYSIQIRCNRASAGYTLDRSPIWCRANTERDNY